ncbi:glucosaminidase domain-containing protein [Bacteroidota bacterium]
MRLALKQAIGAFSKAAVLFAGLLLLACIPAQAQKKRPYPSIQSYIDTFAGQAVYLQRETGIPASVILGVAIVESAYGNSKNSQILHNHFGIIGSNNLRQRGLRYRSRYKEYESDSASFAHFCTVIMSKPYYEKIKGMRNNGIWLKHISKTYTTARSKWAKRVLFIIRKYKLGRFNA